MKITLLFITGFLFNSIQCYDSESYEYNGIEVSPLYETIIYNDIADIINDFDSNNVQYEKAYNESESEEDVENLLAEYHHYLEKAHKQRITFLEKNKQKNKVPPILHEKFTKMISTPAGRHKEHYKNSLFNQEHQFPPALNPFNMFIPFNTNKFTNELASVNDLSPFKKMMLIDDSAKSSLANIPMKPPCCTDGRGTCKQCRHSEMLPTDEDKSFIFNKPLIPIQLDDTINIRIKVDVQLPKTQAEHAQFYNMQSRDKMNDFDASLSKEYLSALKLPAPYLNFPIPMNLLGYKKAPMYNKHDISPLHKITVNKKKKSKVGNGNKKHRKKVITFHNIKIEPQFYQSHFGMYNMSENSKNETENNHTVNLNLQVKNQTHNENVIAATKPIANINTTDSQTEENILLLVNITNNLEKGTNEPHKTENSIETEYKNVISNTTTDKPLHFLKKREIPSHNKSSESPILSPYNSTEFQNQSTTPQSNITITQIKSTTPQVTLNTSQIKPEVPKKKPSAQKKPIIKKKTVAKSKNFIETKNNYTVGKLDNEKSTKLNKDQRQILPPESELLFWPNNNVSKNKQTSKNITEIILESELKKDKLNMSRETLRHNHTRALEQAIFGNVDWDDVDAVSPAFISFVGKYIEGILTFCNERVCHSMKCSKKVCLHRICAPKDRFNNKGHCTGSNITDSKASMESIMDLPSNVAFEIVEILQDKMIGKLFGKITLCINNKCVTFAANKKSFNKNKCSVKDLNPKGHCVHSKGVKVA